MGLMLKSIAGRRDAVIARPHALSCLPSSEFLALRCANDADRDLLIHFKSRAERGRALRFFAA
jgi:hypothetical protein